MGLSAFQCFHRFRVFPKGASSPLTPYRAGVSFLLMNSLAEQDKASVNRKLAMIDELWEDVRRSGPVPVPDSHIAELESRVKGVQEDPGRALPPEHARRALRR